MAHAPFEIIEAEESHLPGIQAIYNQAVRETFSIWSETETTLDQRRQWRATRLASGYPVLVAISPDAPDIVLGYGSFGTFRDFPGYVKTIEHSVYVSPHSQRRGVGGALLQALITRARQSGYSVMVGGVDSANEASLALHQRNGFEKQGCLQGVGQKFGRALDLVFMVRPL